MHTICSLFKNVALYESSKDQNIMHHVSTKLYEITSVFIPFNFKPPCNQQLMTNKIKLFKL